MDFGVLLQLEAASPNGFEDPESTTAAYPHMDVLCDFEVTAKRAYVVF